MASAISQSSTGTVIVDLVSDRSIPLKVCMIILNTAQLISCWIAVGYFIKSYEIWSTLELTLSLVLLFTGNYLIPSIANAVIYWRRWKRSSVSHRKQIEEENKQAWVCLRITLSLIGLPTVGRYIETIIVSKKLSDLEKKHVQESLVTHRDGSQLNPVGNSRLGSSVNQLKGFNMPRSNSVISGMSHTSSINGISENSQRRVRKARRQYKRCEHDGALMALIAGSVGAGPMATGLGFLYFQRIELLRMPTDHVVVVLCSCILNLLWLAATLTHFYPARHVISEAEFERGIRPSNVWGLILLYTSHLVQVTLRILCFVVFTNWFYAYVCIPIIFHWMLGAILLVSYRVYMKSRTVGRPFAGRVRSITISLLSAVFFGYVGIFDFVNGNEGKTRFRYLIYYTFYYIENVVMLVIWLIRNPTTQIQFPVPFVVSILAMFWLGFLLFQLYLYYFSYSPYGSSIIGLCSKRTNFKAAYAQEVREPVFGIPVSQSAVPFWKQNSQGDRNSRSHISGLSGSKSHPVKSPRPIDIENMKPNSILSSQSLKHTPSIFSQPSSQLNFVQERPPQNPIIKPPPVLQQKQKLASTKSNIEPDSSSDSDSSTEELQVFSPKPAHITRSHPDVSAQYSDSVSSFAIPVVEDPVKPSGQSPSGPTPDLSGQFKATPANYKRQNPNSKSMDNIPNVLPAAQPSSSTRRIGVGPVLAGSKGSIRPLPSAGTLTRSTSGRRDPRSLPRRRQGNPRRP